MEKQVLTKEDIITIVKYLIELINSKARLMILITYQTVVLEQLEQLSQQFGVGLARMARTIHERMNVRDNEVFTPIDLINAKHYLLLSTLSEQTSCLSLWIKRIPCRDYAQEKTIC
jgi:DNA-directed RNA polymerase subunit beta